MNTREIPGISEYEWREFRYVMDDGNDNFSGRKGLFFRLTNINTEAAPHSGGIMTENCKLWIPTGQLFHGVSYKGDKEGWRNRLEQAADLLGLLTAWIAGGNRFILSDERSYNLEDCKVEFY